MFDKEKFNQLRYDFNYNKERIAELINSNIELKNEQKKLYELFNNIKVDKNFQYSLKKSYECKIEPIKERREIYRFNLTDLYGQLSTINDDLKEYYNDICCLKENLQLLYLQQNECYTEINRLKDIINNIKESHINHPNFESFVYERNCWFNRLNNIKSDISMIKDQQSNISININDNKRKRQTSINGIDYHKNAIKDFSEQIGYIYEDIKKCKDEINTYKLKLNEKYKEINDIKSKIELNNQKIYYLKNENEKISNCINNLKNC